jgi:hypothetical protein
VEECRACGEELEARFRFCPWCAAPQRVKLTELFAGAEESDHGRALRVSRYLDEHTQQVRFSIWDADGVAQAALSLEAEEATRLSAFLALDPGKRRRSQRNRRIRGYA